MKITKKQLYFSVILLTALLIPSIAPALTPPLSNGEYQLFFNLSTPMDYDFIYYERQNNDTVSAPIYYKISYLPQTLTNNRLLNYQNASAITINYDFVGVSHESTSSLFTYSEDYGGAINNYGSTIDSITGDFIGNASISPDINRAVAAAICNINDTSSIGISSIGSIKSNFIGNYAAGTDGQSYGGAIVNLSISTTTAVGIVAQAKIGSITGSFIGNRATSVDKFAIGGAIYNYAWYVGAETTIGDITGDFIGNYAICGGPAADGYAQGGAIYQHGRGSANASIGNITGDFIGNFVVSEIDYAGGGAIANMTISEAATGNKQTAKIGNITGNFIGNSASALNGLNAYGGAIYNSAGAATSSSTIGTIDGSFIGNYVMTSNTRNALGGAVYANADLTFGADGRDNLFSGNYIDDKRGKVYIAIAVFGNTMRTLSFKMTNGGSFTLNDQIETGSATSNSAVNIGYTVAHTIAITGERDVNGNPDGSIAFNNILHNIGKVNVIDAVIKFGSYKHADAEMSHGNFTNINKTELNLNNSLLYLNYNSFQNLNLGKISSTNNSSVIFSANFESGESDSVTVSTAGASGSINIRSINITGGSTMSVGGSVDLFRNHTNGFLNIGNINNYRLIYAGRLYELSYSSGILSVASDAGVAYPIYVPVSGAFDTLDFGSTEMDAKSTTGILVNDGITTINNSTFSNNSNVNGDGGVILNGSSVNGDLLIVNSSFDMNESSGSGGAIANSAGSVMEIKNTSFRRNSASSFGGAIYSAETFVLSADGEDVVFADNADSTGANDIYVAAGKSLHLRVLNGGAISFFSGISGDAAGYDINITGDGDSIVNIDAPVINASQIYLSNAQLNTASYSHLDNLDFSIDHGILNLADGSYGTFNIKNLTSASGMIALDVNPAANSSTLLDISGDLSGTTKLILNVARPNSPSSKILFANTPNDNPSTEGSFSVYRVNGSALNWYAEPDRINKQWYLNTGSSGFVVPEIIAYSALHTASVEQTRDMFSAIKTNTESSNIYGSGKLSEYQNRSLYDIWVSPVYTASDIKFPVDIESHVYGFEAGFDVQKSEFHRLGLFVSYRQGSYDMDGKGKTIYSNYASNIKIDSYLGGLYYSYDNNSNWIFASAYGGVQKANVSTDDGVEAETDGEKFGLGIAAGHNFEITKTFDIVPEVGVYYQGNRFKDISDPYGKTAQFDDLQLIEGEVGVIFKKTVNIAGHDVYVHLKPSISREFVSNNNVNITGLGDFKTYDNKTLGNGVVGIDTDISKKINIGAAGLYTAGEDYRFYGTRLMFTYRFYGKKVKKADIVTAPEPETASRQDIVTISVENLEKERGGIEAEPAAKANIPAKIAEPKFAFDSSALSDKSKAELNAAAEKIAENPNMKVKVVGHTDSIGTEQYNLQLSLRRAKSAYNYMLNKGVNKERVTIEGKGFSEPVASNKTAEGRAKNRRVEVYVYEAED